VKTWRRARRSSRTRRVHARPRLLDAAAPWAAVSRCNAVLPAATALALSCGELSAARSSWCHGVLQQVQLFLANSADPPRPEEKAALGRAIVIGAGPAGLAAALHLQARLSPGGRPVCQAVLA
jgi:NADPH-dependent 2,4-dienoyl-CoA reductase/sulfur reductase-like enzyme